MLKKGLCLSLHSEVNIVLSLRTCLSAERRSEEFFELNTTTHRYFVLRDDENK